MTNLHSRILRHLNESEDANASASAWDASLTHPVQGSVDERELWSGFENRTDLPFRCTDLRPPRRSRYLHSMDFP